MTEYSEPELYTPHSVVGEPTKKPSSLLRRIIKATVYVGIIAVLLGLFVVHTISITNQPGEYFPIDRPITIPEGMSVKGIAEALQYEGVVQSAELLYYTIVLFHDPTDIKASTYIFDEPLTTTEVAKRLTEGDFDSDLIRFTHFEGERASAIATNAALVLPNFNATAFIELAEPYEGRLYPDTYLLPYSYTETDLFELLIQTYEERVAPVIAGAASSTSLTADEILILASIIEREANTPESMQLVSSVLQNRMEIGMALQADASIEYILDKPLSKLTPEDLKIDTPYNTYLYPGLPPTPIGNPGLDAILAVLYPAETDYFYYITDNDGVFHFAKTYSEHQRNIQIYLR